MDGMRYEVNTHLYNVEVSCCSKVRPGTTLVDSSTVDPQVPQRLAEEAAQRNITFLDAPVSGGSNLTIY